VAEEASPPFGAAPPRVLPTALEAEQALLGSLLSNNPRTAERCTFLRPEHFADPVHGQIFKRAMERISGGLLADAVTLKTDFENTGVLEEYAVSGAIADLQHRLDGHPFVCQGDRGHVAPPAIDRSQRGDGQRGLWRR
jgi:replicative DNA helicase